MSVPSLHPPSPPRRELQLSDRKSFLRQLREWAEARDLRLEEGAVRRFRESAWDTDGLHLRRAGLCLWLREDEEIPVATCAPLSRKAPLGLRRQTVRGGDPNALRAGPVGERLLALRGTRPLRCELELQRSLSSLRVLREHQVVLALELEECQRSGSEATLLRVRAVASESETAALLGSLEASGVLVPTPESLHEEARRLAELPVPTRVELGPTRRKARTAASEYAFAVLRRHAKEMLAHEAGTRLGEDPEELHDMRVATRRLRAAIRLYQEVLPARAISLESELRWLGRALGTVRDLDVQLELLERDGAELPDGEAKALPILLSHLGERRGRARVELLRVLHSHRYAHFVDRIVRVLRRGPGRRPQAGRRPIREVAPPLLHRRQKSCQRLARRLRVDSSDAQLHLLRMRSKKLRYAVEFHRGLYGKPAETFIAHLKALQDLLGEHQDMVVGQQQLKALRDQPLPPRVHFLMGRLLERRATQARTLRARLPRLYAPVHRGPWKRLRRAMKARLP